MSYKRRVSKSRVQTLLEPNTLYISSRTVDFQDRSLLALFKLDPPLSINHLIIKFYTMEGLSPLLQMLNPTTFQIGRHNQVDVNARMPTVEHVTKSTLSFTTRWTRLDQVISEGPKSFPILPGMEFGFSRCLSERDATRRKRITFKLVSTFFDGTEEDELIDEENLESRLTGRRFPDRKEIVLVTFLDI